MHVAALGATTLLITLARDTVWVWPATAVHGVLVVFLFAPLHECIHRTAFRSPSINATVAWVAGCALCLPPKYFRAFHLRHHRYTQQLGRDPELAVPKPTTFGAWLWQVTGVAYWVERIITLARHATGRVNEQFINASARRQIVTEARVVLLFYVGVGAVSWWAHSAVALLYWVIPVLLGQPVLRLFLMAEHTGCPLVADMLANSRTTHAHPLLLKLAWNMPYHAEHHWHPGLPFHALPEAHELLGTFVVVQERGYVCFHRKLLRSYCAADPQRPSSASIGHNNDRLV